MRILLIRHGESHANVDAKVHTVTPDHEIALSSRGMDQAKRAGEYVKAYFEKEYADLFDMNIPAKERTNKVLDKMISESPFGNNKAFSDVFKNLVDKMGDVGKFSEHITPKIRLYHSPYLRTRHSAKLIMESCQAIVTDVKEDVLLCEQNFGLFDGLEDNEQEIKFPAEAKCFNHTKKYGGKFWARYPMGESAFDTAVRLRLFFHQLKEDEENGIRDVVVVCHGTVLRLFTMAWLNHTPEWYADEKSPGNCSIRILDGKKDSGYIFGGYRDGNNWTYGGNSHA